MTMMSETDPTPEPIDGAESIPAKGGDTGDTAAQANPDATGSDSAPADPSQMSFGPERMSRGLWIAYLVTFLIFGGIWVYNITQYVGPANDRINPQLAPDYKPEAAPTDGEPEPVSNGQREPQTMPAGRTDGVGGGPDSGS